MGAMIFSASLLSGTSLKAQQTLGPAVTLSPDEPLDRLPTGSATSAPGEIHGIVTNSDGAVYEGVHISLTHPGADPILPEQTTTTDGDGHFTFLKVAPGPFALSASFAGFSTQSVSGSLQPGQTYQAPTVILPIAMATSEISVSALQPEIGVEILHEEEQQRVLGFVPNFYVVYAPDAPALTVRQKFHLAWRSSIDPMSFIISGASAGYEQANNSFSGYGQGAQGYGKRFGANYADNFIGTMLGGAVLPSLFHQDPRYFYKGTGTKRSRILYAIANAVVCKGDNGHWQLDYSGILGSLGSAGISNLYYPAANRNGISLTIENTLLGTAGSAVGNLFQEFLVRHLTPHAPSTRATTH